LAGQQGGGGIIVCFDKNYLGSSAAPQGPCYHIAATTAKPAPSKAGPVHGLQPCKTAAGDSLSLISIVGFAIFAIFIRPCRDA